MAADLHIHVIDSGVTEEDVKILLSNSLGSKYFAGFGVEHDHAAWTEAYDRIANGASIWVGEVSWLKAALLDDAGTYIPDVVDHVQTVVGEDFPAVTEDLIAELRKGFVLPNSTSYDVSAWEKVETFLREHMGQQLFTVSW